jgi:hypothetical protein
MWMWLWMWWSVCLSRARCWAAAVAWRRAIIRTTAGEIGRRRLNVSEWPRRISKHGGEAARGRDDAEAEGSSVDFWQRSAAHKKVASDWAGTRGCELGDSIQVAALRFGYAHGKAWLLWP